MVVNTGEAIWVGFVSVILICIVGLINGGAVYCLGISI